jgi:cytochrome b involved in lipid metabolism
MSQRFSVADVASHKTTDDLYIIVDEDVYDLTKFQEEHPGGKKSMRIAIAPDLTS